MEWISVEEKLPDNGQYVQVYLSYGKQATCVFFEDENRFIDSLRFQHSNGGVTHWMPLPAPPKENVMTNTWKNCVICMTLYFLLLIAALYVLYAVICPAVWSV